MQTLPCMSYSLHECLHDHFTHVYFDRFFLEHIQERQKFVLQLKSKQTNKFSLGRIQIMSRFQVGVHVVVQFYHWIKPYFPLF